MEKDKDKDMGWKVYFSDNERYADIINGIGCGGQQLVKETDLSEDDSQAGKKARDLFRRTALGMNFAIIGIENQETIDYSLPLRNMNYDVWKMEEDAYDVVALYTNSTELVQVKNYQRKDGKIDMCRAITELMEDSRAEGIETGRREGIETGADFFAALTQRLIMDARMDDLMRATTDKEFRNALYGEYGMEQ